MCRTGQAKWRTQPFSSRLTSLKAELLEFVGVTCATLARPNGVPSPVGCPPGQAAAGLVVDGRLAWPLDVRVQVCVCFQCPLNGN